MITSTRTIPALCPQCTTKIPDMVIKTETIYINCKCGCKKEIPIHEYITQLTQNKDRLYKYVYLCSPHMKPYTYYCSYCYRHLCDDCYKIHIKKCSFIKDVFKLSEVPNMKEAEDHLDYLSSLRNKYSQNEEIQKAYQKCLSSNKEILYLVQFLFKNYYNDHFSLLSLLKGIIKLNTQKVF